MVWESSLASISLSLNRAIICCRIVSIWLGLSLLLTRPTSAAILYPQRTWAVPQSWGPIEFSDAWVLGVFFSCFILLKSHSTKSFGTRSTCTDLVLRETESARVKRKLNSFFPMPCRTGDISVGFFRLERWRYAYAFKIFACSTVFSQWASLNP